MDRVKEIVIKVIPPKVANDFVKKHHYSGKVVPNSNLHFGAFLDGKLHGVLKKECALLGIPFKRYTCGDWIKMGGEYVEGFQLRYVYFIDKSYRERLTVPEIPFSKIDELGAGMYKGENITRAERHSKITQKG